MKHSPQPHGFALALVLITIILTASIVVLFLGSVGRERRGIDLYAKGSQVKSLASTTVARVMGQINAATKEGTASAPASWASQPGMIRTFRSDGTPGNIYKLYSWEDLVEPATGFSPSSPSQQPSPSWKEDTALYTDLNQPVKDVFPIMDPNAEGTVEGFTIDRSSPTVAASESGAPMPVKWLYVLEDGQMTAPTSGSGHTAVIPGATAANPIVGRIAFWTDDETSKVNINTASEGSYWDWPKAASRDEMQFAGNPPVQGEYSRIPGHPAMTSLSAVFPELLAVQDRWDSAYKDQLKNIFALTPKISWEERNSTHQGGSAGGTYPITSFTYNYEPPRSFLDSVPLPKAIALDSDRLYASAGEFWFQPDRKENDALKTNLPNTVKDLQHRQFFLTSNSRAPETTLFETPRISLWPITWPHDSSYLNYARLNQNYTNIFKGTADTSETGRIKPTSQPDPNSTPLQDNPWTTAADQLLAFCATTNQAGSAERYFFQRKNPDHPTEDWDEIARNQQLVKYLRAALDRPVPGIGKSLASKWGSPAADWLALNAFDYCRSFINQNTLGGNADIPAGSKAYAASATYSYTGMTLRGTGPTNMDNYIEANAYCVSPLRLSLNGRPYVTIGARPVLNEVALLFYATNRREPALRQPVPVDPAAARRYRRNPFNWDYLINPGAGSHGGTDAYPAGAQTTGMQAVMLFDFTDMMPSVHSAPFFWIKISGPSFTVNGTSINLPASGGRVVRWDSTAETSFAELFHGADPVDGSTIGFNRVKSFVNTASGPYIWSLISDRISVNPSELTFRFGGAAIKVEIYSCYSDDLRKDPTGDSSMLVSSSEINFSEWNGDLPIPVAPRWNIKNAKVVSNPDYAAPGTRFDPQFIPPDDQPSPLFSGSKVNLAAAPSDEKRDTLWAYSEYSPMISASSASDIRTDADNAFSTTRGSKVVPYYYASASGLVSPVFENRVLSLPASVSAAKRTVFKSEDGGAGTFDLFSDGNVGQGTEEGATLITPYDTVISMVANPSGSTQGDPRLIHTGNVGFTRVDQVHQGLQPQEVFRTSAQGNKPYFPRRTSRAQWHQMSLGRVPFATGYRVLPVLGSNPMARSGQDSDDSGGMGGNLGSKVNTGGWSGIVGAEFGPRQELPAGDWTSSPGNRRDGGFLIRPDQEYQVLAKDEGNKSWGAAVPYFQRRSNYRESIEQYFSPNRQVPSPVLLGCLPTSLSQGWQTLAFSPSPAAADHPGLDSPPDHLFLDLFWMPVVEPYAISDQFSTAGKININYRIMPFSYIHRKTGMHALMKATWATAIPDAAAEHYKSPTLMRTNFGGLETRFPLDIEETLKGFDAHFDNGEIFRSASQLCEMHLVPEGSTLTAMEGSFWNDKRLTSDTAREEPYNHLYSRVTTKSNTFTVHWRAEVLRKAPRSAPAEWNEARDQTVAVLRGSTQIERYIDPNAVDIPDYATDPQAGPLSAFYKWRVVSEEYFQP